MSKFLKISEVRQILQEECFTERSLPSSRTVVNWLEEGFLRGKRLGRQRIWYIEEDSLNDFITKFQSNSLEPIEAD
jgi:hypothetical protein